MLPAIDVAFIADDGYTEPLHAAILSTVPARSAIRWTSCVEAASQVALPGGHEP